MTPELWVLESGTAELVWRKCSLHSFSIFKKFFSVLGMEPRALSMLGMCSNIELHLWPFKKPKINLIIIIIFYHCVVQSALELTV